MSPDAARAVRASTNPGLMGVVLALAVWALLLHATHATRAALRMAALAVLYMTSPG